METHEFNAIHELNARDISRLRSLRADRLSIRSSAARRILLSLPRGSLMGSCSKECETDSAASATVSATV